MENFDRETLVEMLKNNIVKIEFIKANGDIRVMNATLLASELPIQEKDESKPKRAVNLDKISVWDVEIQDWRGFRVDSLISAQPLNLPHSNV